MPLNPETLDAMLAAGFSAEQIATVVKAELVAERGKAAAADDARRARAAEKKRRQRAEVRLVSPDVPGTNGDTGGQTGTLGDNEGQAGTTGDAADPQQKEAPQTPIEKHPPGDSPSDPKGSSVPKGTDGRRGRRIPDDFAGSDDARSIAAEFGYHGDQADEPLAEFCDYWRGVPGLRGTKLDWPATLRNRFREIGRREQRAAARASPAQRPASAQQRAFERARDAHLELMEDDRDKDPFDDDADAAAHPAAGRPRNGHAHPRDVEPPGGWPRLAPPRPAGPPRPH